MKWKYRCFTFSKVRQLINEDAETVKQCMKILYVLESCCSELTPDIKQDWEHYDDFRDLASEIHETIEELDEDDYDEAEYIVNNLLDEFYDLCDYAGVWLSL